jgi:hypothetical protein
MKLGGPMWPADWVELYLDLVRYDRELEGDEGLRQVLSDQFREANYEFGRYIEKVYPTWIGQSGRPPHDERPVLSHEVLPTWVFPLLGDNRPVFFILVDCMRYDQWLEFEALLYPLFNIEKDFHYSDAVFPERNFQRTVAGRDFTAVSQVLERCRRRRAQPKSARRTSAARFDAQAAHRLSDAVRKNHQGRRRAHRYPTNHQLSG